MKQCTDCAKEGIGSKKNSEFYATKRRTRDGLDNYCIKHRNKRSKNSHRNGQIPPESTRYVMKLLKAKGMPVYPASSIGLNYVDLVVFGCVPIEAKKAIRDKNGTYLFYFTYRQKLHLLHELKNGFLIIYLNDDPDRVFVIPADDKWIDNKFKNNASGIAFVIDSSHGNAKSWRHISQYENAFYLIEEARIKISNEMREHV